MSAEALEAAAHWGGAAALRLIRDRENAVFEAALPAGLAALRLHRVGYQSEAAIRSELWWCAALADAGAPVPRPIPAQDGELLHRLDDVLAGRLLPNAQLRVRPVAVDAFDGCRAEAGDLGEHRPDLRRGDVVGIDEHGEQVGGVGHVSRMAGRRRRAVTTRPGQATGTSTTARS